MSILDDDPKVQVIEKDGKYLIVTEDGVIRNGPFDFREFYLRSYQARTIRKYMKYVGRPIPESVKAVLEFNGDPVE